jgi:hypothetical protein
MAPLRRISVFKQINRKMAGTDSSVFEEFVYDKALRVFNRT